MKRLLVCLVILGCLVGCNSNSAVNVALNQPDGEDELWTYTNVDDLEAVALPDLKNEFTISFWVKPEENRPGTTLFHLGDDTDYVCVTTSGYNDGVYSGLTIERRVGVKDHWDCADGGVTVKTNRYNLITFTVKDGAYSLYMNGEKVISSDMKGNGFDPSPECADLYLGYSPIGYPGVKGYIADAVFSRPAMSADEHLTTYNSKVANVLLDTIEFKEAEDMRNDLWLVDYQLDGLDVNWKVSDESLMNFQGLIKRPIEKDAQLTLTARMDTADSHAEKSFVVNLKSDSDENVVKHSVEKLDTYFDAVMHSGAEVPASIDDCSVVYWTGDNAVIENGVLKKISNGKQNVEITAFVSKGSVTEEKKYFVCLLDEVYGYALSYFNGELGEETGYLALSTDGLHWEKVEGYHLNSELGTGRIRDPFIGRDVNGEFVILATEGFDNPNIYVFRSPDLMNISSESLVQVAFCDSGLKMTGLRAWAPEMKYDMNEGVYRIYFSDNGYEDEQHNKTSAILQVTTTDLEEFSYPGSFFEPGYTVIDGTIYTDNGKYYMIYKDERKAAQTVFVADTYSLSRGFVKAHDDMFLSLTKYLEGPFTFKVGDKRLLYVDHFPDGKFLVGYLDSDLHVDWLDESAYTLPEEDVRHGSVIELTRDEYDALLKSSE